MAREDVVEPLERVGVERDVQGPDGGVELLLRARTDDRCGDRRLVQQPGQGDVAGLVAEVVGEVLVLADLVVVLLQRLGRPALGAPDAVALLLAARRPAGRRAAATTGSGPGRTAVRPG